MSFATSSLMSSSRPPFSVAKLVIEGAREGADQTNHDRAPPHLSGPQKASFPYSFPMNPFSLSRRSLLNSHACTSSVSQSSLADVYDISPSPGLASSVSSPSYVHSLFPNPFLAKQSLDSQPAFEIIKKTPTTSCIATASTPQTLTQPSQILKKSITLDHHTASSPIHQPCRPWPDCVMTPSPLRPRVMVVDRLFSWHT